MKKEKFLQFKQTETNQILQLQTDKDLRWWSDSKMIFFDKYLMFCTSKGNIIKIVFKNKFRALNYKSWNYKIGLMKFRVCKTLGNFLSICYLIENLFVSTKALSCLKLNISNPTVLQYIRHKSSSSRLFSPLLTVAVKSDKNCILQRTMKPQNKGMCEFNKQEN